MYFETLAKSTSGEYILCKDKRYYEDKLQFVYEIRKRRYIGTKNGAFFYDYLNPPLMFKSLRKAKIEFLLISL